MSEQTDVVVVGAGGGGAVLGLALAQKGIRAIVLEQASGPPSGLRGEILQPNGQRILDRLGVLGNLPSQAVNIVTQFHFCRAGRDREGARLFGKERVLARLGWEGETPPGAGRCDRLCSIDYGMLPPPYNRAIVTLPNAAHHVILDALETVVPDSLRYGTVFKGLLRERGQVVGVEAEQAGRAMTIRASLVVGADGALSKVREALGIPTQLHRYREGYLIAMLDNYGLSEARYYVGRRSILGIFPAAGRKAYLFYMIPAEAMSQIKAAGLEPLRRAWSAIAPDLAPIFTSLSDWNQTAYMPTGRVRTSTWVADGAVLIGDAAHAMNPHASQGRMQAMADAVSLADLLPPLLKAGELSARALSAFERARRPQVDMLQQLADEQVIFWNSGNPLVGYMRDRVFRTLDRNRRLRYQVLATTAGLRATAPFGLMDRVIAAGFWPDRYADRLPADEVTGLYL